MEQRVPNFSLNFFASKKIRKQKFEFSTVTNFGVRKRLIAVRNWNELEQHLIDNTIDQWRPHLWRQGEGGTAGACDRLQRQASHRQCSTSFLRVAESFCIPT